MCVFLSHFRLKKDEYCFAFNPRFPLQLKHYTFSRYSSICYPSFFLNISPISISFHFPFNYSNFFLLSARFTFSSFFVFYFLLANTWPASFSTHLFSNSAKSSPFTSLPFIYSPSFPLFFPDPFYLFPLFHPLISFPFFLSVSFSPTQSPPYPSLYYSTFFLLSLRFIPLFFAPPF